MHRTADIHAAFLFISCHVMHQSYNNYWHPGRPMCIQKFPQKAPGLVKCEISRKVASEQPVLVRATSLESPGVSKFLPGMSTKMAAKNKISYQRALLCPGRPALNVICDFDAVNVSLCMWGKNGGRFEA
jgi:hypothetical protein